MRQHLRLSNCTSEPLSSYLKSLGVLRLVSEQADEQARGYWKTDAFVLVSSLSEQDLVEFSVRKYAPTPVVSPWNGASGFWDKTSAGKALTLVETSTSPRLSEYRKAVAAARETVRELGLSGKPVKDEKQALMRLCRARLPDSALRWLDACFLLANERSYYPPLLGTGGNDGKLDFSANFIQNVINAIDIGTAKSPRAPSKKRQSGFDERESEARLRYALFGQGDVSLLDTAVGQFNPGGVGGPNAIAGFEGSSVVNPWDFVLMIEGAIMFAGSVTWRLGSNRNYSAFPFMVEPSVAGWGSLAESSSLIRGEVWLPIWDRPATCREVERLFSEGRAQVGRRPAKNGVDFARAVTGLGVDRGINSFRRYGFLQRSGRAHLGAPLGRFRVQSRSDVGVLEDADWWLEYLRRAAADKESPASVIRALREIEEAIFAYCAGGRPQNLQRVLMALGRAERLLSNSPRLQKLIPPLQSLSDRWILGCDDKSPEFRIALALAAMTDSAVGPIRMNLEPVSLDGQRWKWSSSSGRTVRTGDDLLHFMEAVLERRLIAYEQSVSKDTGPAVSEPHLPFSSRFEVTLSDVSAFLHGCTDQGRIRDLMWGFIALRPNARFPKHDSHLSLPDRPLPAIYALLKLLFWPGSIAVSDDGVPIKVAPEPSLIHLLKRDDLEAATRLATRRLISSGLCPLATRGPMGARSLDFVVSKEARRHLLPSLLIPVLGVRELCDLCLRPSKSQER